MGRKWVVIALLFMTFLALTRLMTTDVCRARVFYSNGCYYAVAVHGSFFDATAMLWVKCENRWFLYYLDHEIIILIMRFGPGRHFPCG